MVDNPYTLAERARRLVARLDGRLSERGQGFSELYELRDRVLPDLLVAVAKLQEQLYRQQVILGWLE